MFSFISVALVVTIGTICFNKGLPNSMSSFLRRYVLVLIPPCHRFPYLASPLLVPTTLALVSFLICSCPFLMLVCCPETIPQTDTMCCQSVPFCSLDCPNLYCGSCESGGCMFECSVLITLTHVAFLVSIFRGAKCS